MKKNKYDRFQYLIYEDQYILGNVILQWTRDLNPKKGCNTQGVFDGSLAAGIIVNGDHFENGRQVYTEAGVNFLFKI